MPATWRRSVLVSLSGSFQTAPNFWLNPKNGVTYQVAVQSPQYRVTSLQDLMEMPINDPSTKNSQVLSNLAQVTPTARPAVVSHYNVQPVIDVYVSTQDRDLGAVAKDTMNALKPFEQNLPRGTRIVVRGQIETMKSSFLGLGIGLVMAIVLIYFLIVVNFQSWLDPFIIITALPGALAGICWILLLTHTRLSVPSLTGAVMCMGVATANSILMISFARDRMHAGIPAAQAALEAGYTRIRPVLMTALAMIIGMFPMALGLGEGGEQNAPLGRAVIGGLIFATVATLFFVPTIFAMIHGHIEAKQAEAETRHRMIGTETEATLMDSHSNPTEVLDDGRQAPEITPPPKLPPAPPRKALLLIGLVLLLLVVGGLITMLARMRNSHVLADETERESIPTVAVVHPTAEKPDEELVLPGSLQAYEESPIYARTNGYLLRWYKDIGSRVKQGELLADIDTPEVDQELMQVRANRQQIVAQMDLAKINADRYVSLRKTDSVSQQEADQQSSGYQQAKANLDAADATVRRLEQLESFKHVYAPFSGVLTKRNVDPGALINAGGTGKELFDIAKVDPLAGVRQRSAKLRARHQERDGSLGHSAGVARREIQGHGGAHRGVDRSHDAHFADRSGCAQSRRTPAARLVRRGALPHRHQRAEAHHPGQRDAVSPGRPAGRRRRQRWQSSSAADYDWQGLRHDAGNPGRRGDRRPRDHQSCRFAGGRPAGKCRSREAREASSREAVDPGGGRSCQRLLGGMHRGAELPSSADAGSARLQDGSSVARGCSPRTRFPRARGGRSTTTPSSTTTSSNCSRPTSRWRHRKIV